MRKHRSRLAGVMGLLYALCLTIGGCSEKPMSAESQQQRSSDVPRGSIVLTEDSRVVRVQVDTRTCGTLFNVRWRLKYALPIPGSDPATFAVVYDHGNIERLGVIVPSTGAESAIGEYRHVGLPTVSPDGLLLAFVAEPVDKKISLFVWGMHDNTIRSVPGDFAIDNAGPGWLTWQAGTEVFVLAARTGKIARLRLSDLEIEFLCAGHLPVVFADRQRFAFLAGGCLWLYDLRGKNARKVANIGEMAQHYRACQVSADGRYAIVRTLWPAPLGKTGVVKDYPSLLLVDLATGGTRVLEHNLGREGPWAWLPGELP